MFVESSKTYVGVVEDNQDPKRIGRCRIRIIDVFDEIPVEDIPWASPWKDINGNEFNVHEKGKIVTCVFDSGNIYKPEYIYADHYNLNLERKLRELSDEAYASMRTLMFDHKTQIYSNDDEGLMVDYKFHNMNIREEGIHLNLKDSYSKLNLGDRNSDQQVILGTNFLNWFDKFIKQLATLGGGPFLSTVAGAPVLPTPSFVRVLDEYFQLKDPKFLSNNVYVPSNFQINSVSAAHGGFAFPKYPARQMQDVKGDNFKATETISESSIEFDSNVPSFIPNIDSNDQSNVSQDPTSGGLVPKSNPVYLDPDKGPLSDIISDFAKQMVRIAETQVGVTENPKNSNTGPEVFVYQDSTWLKPVRSPQPGEKYNPPKPGWPWCAAFVCFLFKAVSGIKDINYSFSLPRTAGAYDFENWARKNSRYVDIIKPPFDKILPGDIIIFNFGHIGISISTITGNRILTIEGNTSPLDIPDMSGIANNFATFAPEIPGTEQISNATGIASQASSQLSNIPGTGNITGNVNAATSALNNPDLSSITNFSKQREGDGVYKKIRKLSLIRSVLRLKYDESKVELKPREEVVTKTVVKTEVVESSQVETTDPEASTPQQSVDPSVESSTVGKTGLTREEIDNGGLESITKRINNNTPYEFGYVYFQGLAAKQQQFQRGGGQADGQYSSKLKKLENTFKDEWELNGIENKKQWPTLGKTNSLGLYATTLKSIDEWYSLFEKYFKRLG